MAEQVVVVSSETIQRTSEHWVKKMLTFFQLTDTEHQGFFTFVQAKTLFEERLSEMLTSDQEDKKGQLFRKYWDYFWGQSSMTVGTQTLVRWSSFLAARESAVLLTKEADVQTLRDMLNVVFDFIDCDRNEVISSEEFMRLGALYGLTKYQTRVAFASLDENCDGNISREEYLHTCVTYFQGTEWNDSSLVFGKLTNHAIEIAALESIRYEVRVPKSILEDMGELWVRKMLTYFRSMDVDGLGQLTKAEMARVVGRRVAHSVTRATRQGLSMLEDLGWNTIWHAGATHVDGVEVITFQNFLSARHRAATSHRSKDEGPLKALYQVIFSATDANRDGKMQLQEYVTAMTCNGLSPHQLAVSFSNQDVNGDGVLDLSEGLQSWLKFFYSKEWDCGTLVYGTLDNARLVPVH